ncbi:MAG: ABC transporter ATP-binding protein [Longimicrobiales bacterium]|nr:ABC transporter ATP-binding protein [Longimicrobiales bacterium]
MHLSVRNLSKTYPNGVQALRSVSLEIPPGMFGLLGPNGAGKSTFMRILATLQDADTGSASLGAIDMLSQKDAVRRLLGYLPQEFGVYPRTSAIHMLDHLALLKGVSAGGERRELVEALLHRVNLWADRKKDLSGFSGGMRQRFGIAQALIGDPRLLIVDEPTAGLDPGERNRFYNLLAEIGEDRVVILSTHIVEDVRELCTRMAILHQGEVRFAGSPDHAIGALTGRVWEKRVEKSELAALEQDHLVISSKLVAGKPVVHVLAEAAPGDGFRPADVTLEDVFFTRIHDERGPAGGAPPREPTGRPEEVA